LGAGAIGVNPLSGGIVPFAKNSGIGIQGHNSIVITIERSWLNPNRDEQGLARKFSIVFYL